MTIVGRTPIVCLANRGRMINVIPSFAYFNDESEKLIN